MYLAARRRPCASDDITAALWPVPREDTGALRVCVARLRAKIGDGAVVLGRNGYTLGDDIIVDLDNIERLVLEAQRQNPIAPELRSQLQAELDRLILPRPARTDTWEWFAPVGVRIDDLTRQLATVLGRDALEAGDFAAALNLGQRIIEVDPCDEPARELRIRAHLAAGDRASAYREFRLYREVLESELGARPSTELAALVQEQAV